MSAQLLSFVLLFATSWTIACQVPLSMGFPRKEYWSGLPWSRDWTRISCIDRWILYHWATWEVRVNNTKIFQCMNTNISPLTEPSQFLSECVVFFSVYVLYLFGCQVFYSFWCYCKYSCFTGFNASVYKCAWVSLILYPATMLNTFMSPNRLGRIIDSLNFSVHGIMPSVNEMVLFLFIWMLILFLHDYSD